MAIFSQFSKSLNEVIDGLQEGKAYACYACNNSKPKQAGGWISISNMDDIIKLVKDVKSGKHSNIFIKDK